jgi:hypothetical protein
MARIWNSPCNPLRFFCLHGAAIGFPAVRFLPKQQKKRSFMNNFSNGSIQKHMLPANRWMISGCAQEVDNIGPKA